MSKFSKGRKQTGTYTRITSNHLLKQANKQSYFKCILIIHKNICYNSLKLVITLSKKLNTHFPLISSIIVIFIMLFQKYFYISIKDFFITFSEGYYKMSDICVYNQFLVSILINIALDIRRIIFVILQ